MNPETNDKPRKRSHRLMMALAIGMVVGVIAGIVVFWRARQWLQRARTVQTALATGQAAAPTPARKQFSAGFLQMAFGENPRLRDEVASLLAGALQRNPKLADFPLTLMLVTYRQEAGGPVREVAIRLVSQPTAAKRAPGPQEQKSTGEFQANIREMKESALEMVGGHVILIAAPAEQTRQQVLLTALQQNRNRVIADYLQQPVRVVAVMPEPVGLVGTQFGKHQLAAIVKGDLSLLGGTGQVVALGYDREQAAVFSHFISDTRAVLTGIARMRLSGGPIEMVLRAIQRATVRTVGTSTVVQGRISEQLIEIGLPRVVKASAAYVRQMEFQTEKSE